ncbi:MAG: hypothetical protein NZ890_06650 [Myxococcota bacterium]|nr:hypothetical protein [Myxococcota bacterium]
MLKLEFLQRGGSCQIRGASNALALAPYVPQVLTASGGNHGIGVALAARPRCSCQRPHRRAAKTCAESSAGLPLCLANASIAAAGVPASGVPPWRAGPIGLPSRAARPAPSGPNAEPSVPPRPRSDWFRSAPGGAPAGSASVGSASMQDQL